jgi:alkylhydroperoxidase family enzyme
VAGIEQSVVDAVLDDHRTAPIEESLRGVLSLLQKITLEPAAVGPKDIEPLLAAGLDAQAIHEAMYVAFVFNVIDRLADAFDFPVLDAEHQRRTARMLQLVGYGMGALPA